MKILLYNYSEKEAEAIQKSTSADVFRGYLSKQSTAIEHSGDSKPMFYQFTPIAPYECSFVFINLDNYDAADTEFKSKRKIWGSTETRNLYDYWSRNDALLTFFIGDTNVTDLLQLGTPLRLKISSGVDTETVLCFKEGDMHHPLIKDINERVKMPTTHYIETLGKGDKNVYYDLNTKAYISIRNKNGDILSAFLSKSNSDYSGEEPGVMLWPSTKSLSKSTTRIVEHFTASVEDEDWLQSDVFYPPTTLKTLNEEVDAIIEDAKRQVTDRRTKMEEHRTKYSYLKDLVTSKGDTLVNAVHKVLTDVLGLTVTKSDEINASNPKEDLLVEYKGQQILLEVKGTNRPYPSLKFPQQSLQHAIRQGLKDVTKTGLILNHDFNTTPDERKLAYNDTDTAPLIEDIYFIGCVELLKLTIDVLEGNLSNEDAGEILFGSLNRAVYPPSS